MGSAESLIRGEDIRFMRQQQSSKSNLEIVLVDQPAEAPPSEPSSTAEPSPSVPTANLLDELRMKYGFKRPESPV